VSPSKRRSKNLIDAFALDAPYVTDTRRLLQVLHRQQKAAPTEIRSYMVTSAGGGDGKSTVCALMALVSATIFHRKTLLIDGDPYLPTVHSLLGVARGPGLTDVLRRESVIQEASHATSIPRLWVLPCGYPRGGASGTYDDEEFARLLQEAGPSYDLILIDAPPTVSTIEPILMAEHVDSILLVAMAGRTPLAMVRRSKQILEPFIDKIAGVVLNNAIDGLPYSYDYRYYGYGEAKPPRIRQPAPPPGPDRPNSPARLKNNGGEH
jgi:capsular exopolysaccharide synthesis family protein